MLVLYGEILQSCQRIDHDLLIHLYVDRDHVARPLNKIEIHWFSVHNIFLKKGKIAKRFGKTYTLRASYLQAYALMYEHFYFWTLGGV